MSTGVLQGDVLAPFLFIIVIDYVMKNSGKDYGFITHPRRSSRLLLQRLNDLDYADDIALFESSQERAQEQLTECSKAALNVGLEINIGKTKEMIINNNTETQPLKLNNEEIEIVNGFKYLGSLVASSEKDIKCRKGQAWGAFWKMEKLWKSSVVDIRTKIRIFQASAISILLYGETWLIPKYLMDSLDSFATSCYRIMLNIKRIDHVTNVDIYK